MKNLYGSVSISKKLESIEGTICENINYYKLKNKKFGIEIQKMFEDEEVEKINIEDITNDEQKINNVLSIFVNKQIQPNSEDIIEDMLKQYI